ncbi:MAG: ABC transporter ATP-binding protein, partial [Planctomycetes bacterium]|nr:ABC transporter ATP-binding protein [Planctomycetota bacterium]
MIRVESLLKSYGALRAVDGLDFEVRRGETFGLLGPNGAGKSTTISLMVGALEPDDGGVRFEDGSAPSSVAARRKLGVAPQRLALYEDLTASENLRFFGKIYGLTGERLRERVRFGLSFAGLEERADARVKTYSGGMQRRLNLSCAVLHAPEILFLDEPTAGVDPQSRNRLFENIEVLKREGCTLIYTTHYMEEAERLCDRVAIMDAG